MTRLPRVVSPIRTLFTRDGIDIALISVEAWPRRLVVRLAALPSEIADERLRQYEANFERWGKIFVARGKTAAGDPPTDPGTALLGDLQIAVQDDAGTTYTPRGGNTGGTGSEWHCDCFFAADIPDSIQWLTIRVNPTDGEPAQVRLDVTGFEHYPA